ncbi:MAG: hypothetical protein ABUK03_03925 [Dehalococcoidales bacterium]
MEGNRIKRLITSIKCGVCGRHYEANSVKLLGQRDDLWFLGAECKSCRARALVAVVLKEEGLPAMVTDLTAGEQRLFRHMAAPTADELLEMHGFLKDFKGDFASLFRDEEDNSEKEQE